MKKKENERIIVLTGGGTGGHVIPNLCLLPILRKHFDKIYYIGTNGIEKNLTKCKVDKYFEIKAYKLNRRNIFGNLLLPFKLLASVNSCKKILKDIKPSVIFSKGGYVSVPVCLAGKKLDIPIVSHESDLSLGKANKLIYKLSTTLCTTFEKTAEKLGKAVFTGSPVRQELFAGNKREGYNLTHFDGSRPIILVTGGSTGAQAINNVIFDSIEDLTKKYDIIHLVGKGKGKKIDKTHYFQMEFCDKIENLFAISDIVISRAGSNAIYELLALNKPMILVPLPKGNSRGDQVENARYFEERKYAKVICQEQLNKATLLSQLDEMNNNKTQIIERLKKVPKSTLINGAEGIVREILLAEKKGT